MSKEEGYELLNKCVDEVRKRFIVNLPSFRVRLVDDKGVQELETIGAPLKVYK